MVETIFQGDVFLHKKEYEKGFRVGCEVQFYLSLNNRGRPQAANVGRRGSAMRRLF